ncbi:hypothetical protein D3C81_923520 [compost metagenome]
MKRPIEIVQHLCPFGQSMCNIVKLFFDIRCKVKIYNTIEMLYKEIIHDNTNIRWEHFPFFCSCYFRLSNSFQFSILKCQHTIVT